MRTEQLDLFANNELTAYPTQQSAAGLVPRAAARLGYDYVAICAHCADAVTLTGQWGPTGWVHRSTGSRWCRASRLRCPHLGRDDEHCPCLD